MPRFLVVLALCSSVGACSFSHGFIHRNDPKPPTVALSPQMAKLDREQRDSWRPFVDMGIAFAGFLAGPVVCDERQPQSYCEPINLAGLGVAGAFALSACAAELLWGDPW